MNYTAKPTDKSNHTFYIDRENPESKFLYLTVIQALFQATPKGPKRVPSTSEVYKECVKAVNLWKKENEQ